MIFSVVMPTFIRTEEHASLVKETIENIKASSYSYELIIIDDGSILPTGFLRNEADTYIRHNPKNKGIAPSWNDGKNVARGEFVAIINDDIKVPYNWLDSMALAFDYSDCAVSLVKEAGPDVTPEQLEGECEKGFQWPSGYCFMLKKGRFFEEFDEQFVPYNFEDIDYWERAMKGGWCMYKAPLAIWHKEGDTIHSMGYDATSEINLQKFIKKHGFNPQTKYFN